MVTGTLRSTNHGRAMDVVLTTSIQMVGAPSKAEATEAAPRWLLTISTELSRSYHVCAIPVGPYLLTFLFIA